MPTAVITGASSGIGKACAFEFASHGFDVVLVARSREKLHIIKQRIERQYGVRAMVAVLDLTRSAAPAKLIEALDQTGIQVEVLINSAGLGDLYPFTESD